MKEFNKSGSKYLRRIKGCVGDCLIDIYGVLKTFEVTCPARQHAIKKLLCAGLRNKASELQDLEEAADAIKRAIELLKSESEDFLKMNLSERAVKAIEKWRNGHPANEAIECLELFLNKEGKKDGKSLKFLQKEIYNNAVAHGWWEKERPIPETLCLIHSEVSEALEAYRKGDMKNFAEELADVIIRVLDAAEGYGHDMESEVIKKHEINKKKKLQTRKQNLLIERKITWQNL